MIAKGDMFGPRQRIMLRCLDVNIPKVKQAMEGIKMELQDGYFPLLVDQQVIFSTSDRDAFKDADYAILLGAFPKQDGMRQEDYMEKNILIFKTMGNAIKQYAKATCKVLVVGQPANTNAAICAKFADNIPKSNFFTLSRLDHNRAVGILATKAQVPVHEVRNVIIWGGSRKAAICCDLQLCTVKGKPVKEFFSSAEDQKWLTDTFPAQLNKRGQDIMNAFATQKASALSAARAIVSHVCDLFFGRRSGEVFSMGVNSDGNPYGIQGGLYFSFPVRLTGRGTYKLVKGLAHSVDVREKIQEQETTLIAEKAIVTKLCGQHT